MRCAIAGEAQRTSRRARRSPRIARHARGAVSGDDDGGDGAQWCRCAERQSGRVYSREICMRGCVFKRRLRIYSDPQQIYVGQHQTNVDQQKKNNNDHHKIQICTPDNNIEIHRRRNAK